jgi:hypothetical protein
MSLAIIPTQKFANIPREMAQFQPINSLKTSSSNGMPSRAQLHFWDHAAGASRLDREKSAIFTVSWCRAVGEFNL